MRECIHCGGECLPEDYCQGCCQYICEDCDVVNREALEADHESDDHLGEEAW